MAVEPNLRALFHSGDAERPGGDGHGIDTAAVIRRAKRRRLPSQIGVVGVFALAIGGLGVAGLQGLNPPQPMRVTAGSAESSSPDSDHAPAIDEPLREQSESAGVKRAPADRINLCGGALADVAPSASGLTLTTDFPDAAVGAPGVTGRVTLTNTGSRQVTGYTSATPAVTLSQGGIVLWHSNGPTIMMAREVDLAPGESIDFEASFVPVVCSVEDDSAESFRTDLPAAPAGEYEVSAASDVTVGDSLELVTGPLQTIRLR
jgi:hypothetical protein